MVFDVVQLLCDLVRIPSVNPMGREVSGDQYYEYAMTEKLESLFQEMGLAYSVQEVEPSRTNILARLEGDPQAGVIVFEAHQDTVPVEGMTIEPWKPEVRDDRVFGRGACDIKGGMACMLTAFSRLANERPTGMPTIVMACSVNEEYGYGGATTMARNWAAGESPIMPSLPDAVVVAEPTLLDVVVAHKGVVRWRCHTGGRAAHSSMPHLGDNAFYRMARVLAAIERYAEDETPNLGEHALVGRPTLSVGVINGGISVNTVPDQCTIEIDRRVLPGEDAMEAYQQVIEYVADVTNADPLVNHDPPYIASNGLDIGRNADLAARLGDVARANGGGGRKIGVPYGTDAPAFDEIKAPTVVFGPGSIDQAHTCDEWVSIDQLHKAVEIYYQFAKMGWPQA
jgi:acetylornithine deacetylase